MSGLPEPPPTPHWDLEPEVVDHGRPKPIRLLAIPLVILAVAVGVSWLSGSEPAAPPAPAATTTPSVVTYLPTQADLNTLAGLVARSLELTPAEAQRELIRMHAQFAKRFPNCAFAGGQALPPEATRKEVVRTGTNIARTARVMWGWGRTKHIVIITTWRCT